MDTTYTFAAVTTSLINSNMLSIVVFIIVLCVLSIIIFIAYRRAAARSRQLNETQQQLIAERDAARRAHRSVIIARDKTNLTERQKNEFIHDIVYEITEPTNAIVGYTQLIVDTTSGHKREILERFVEQIREDAVRLRKQVNNVIISDCPDETSCCHTTFDFSDIIDNTVFNNISRLAGFKPPLVNNTSPDCSMIIVSSKNSVEHIINELFTIAVDYSVANSLVLDYGFDDQQQVLQTIIRFAISTSSDEKTIKNNNNSFVNEAGNMISSRISALDKVCESIDGHIDFTMNTTRDLAITFCFQPKECGCSDNEYQNQD